MPCYVHAEMVICSRRPVAGVSLHQHGTTLYNSVYIGDDLMIVNAHRFGINAYATPVLHLRRVDHGGMFDGYAESFEDVWRLSRPAKEG